MNYEICQVLKILRGDMAVGTSGAEEQLRVSPG